MSLALKAGLGYFAIVFAVAFAVGTLRVLVLAPRLGGMLAVAMELPVILVVSWITCRWITVRLRVPLERRPMLVMGGFAFLVLMAVETIVGITGFGRSIDQILTAYGTLEGILGLLGQLAFGVIPVLQLGRRPRSSGRAQVVPL